MNETAPTDTSSWFYLFGGLGQAAVGAGLAEATSSGAVQAPNSLAVLLIAFTGMVTAVGAIIQILTNATYKQRHLEASIRLKRIENGIPCEDGVCPIQRIAERRISPFDVMSGSGEFPFLKPVKTHPDDPTVDLTEMDGRE